MQLHGIPPLYSGLDLLFPLQPLLSTSYRLLPQPPLTRGFRKAPQSRRSSLSYTPLQFYATSPPNLPRLLSCFPHPQSAHTSTTSASWLLVQTPLIPLTLYGSR